MPMPQKCGSILQWLGYKSLIDFVVRDRGAGPFIDQWMHSDPQPTEEFIASKEPEYLAWLDSEDAKMENQQPSKKLLMALAVRAYSGWPSLSPPIKSKVQTVIDENAEKITS